jgi:hypothetical protein
MSGLTIPILRDTFHAATMTLCNTLKFKPYTQSKSKKEMISYEIRVSDEGRDQFGAKIGSHDDLVCALGMARWCGEEFGNREIKIW